MSQSNILNGLIAATGMLVLSACSGVQHTIPEVNKASEARALAEIQGHGPNIKKNVMSQEKAELMLHEVHAKLLPAAQEVCNYVGEQSTCWWDVDYSGERAFNAYATDKNQIVVYHDVMTSVSSEDELAMVLAHEMGHHIAEHIDESKNRATAGAVMGGLAMAALMVAGGGGNYYCDYTCQINQQNALKGSMQLGAAMGSLSYSVKQEKEADMLSAYILQRAGFDVLEARGAVVKLGVMSNRTKTGFFDTHPAGPERLATFDEVISELVVDEDGLPNKRK